MTTLTVWEPHYRKPSPVPTAVREPAPVPMPRQASPVEFRMGLSLIKWRREQQTLREHRPSRKRLRIVRFAGFPIPALITRCQCCNAIWPCRALYNVVRQRLGFTRKLEPAFRFLRKHTDLAALARMTEPGGQALCPQNR